MEQSKWQRLFAAIPKLMNSSLVNIRLNTAVLMASVLLGAPAAVEPTATLFENGQVKVIRALERAHLKGKFHEHTLNRVMIYLQPGKQRFEYQDGRQPSVFDWKAGEVVWSAAGGMHSPEVISDDAFNIIEVELKFPGSGKAIASALDPVKLAPNTYKVEFENSQVRVLRVKIGAHQATPMHEHSLNRVTVFLTDQDFRVTDSQGNVSMVKHNAGEAVWGTPLTHMEENISDLPFEVVTVELKD